MRRIVVGLALSSLLASGCLDLDPSCKRGAGPTDCSYHFQGVTGGATFASRWNASRVEGAMRAAGWTDAVADGMGVFAGPATHGMRQFFAQPVPLANDSWGFGIHYDEGMGKRVIRATAEAQANASAARHDAEFLRDLGKFESALGETHAGNVTWSPSIAIE